MSHRFWFRSRQVIVVFAALAALGWAAGCSGGSGASEDDAGGGSDGPVGWEVGSCVRQVAGPETIPPDISYDERQLMEAQQQFEPVACSDDRAISRITDMGAELDVEVGQPEPVDDGCPDDTDAAYEAPDPVTGLETRIVCARNLEPPHPGDPGGGAGNYLVGDCVFVLSSYPGGPLNDRIPEMPCDQEGWFATIVALAPDAAGCPPEALSRLASPQQPGEVLCLAPDGPTATGGALAGPGECITIEGVRPDLPPVPADCADVDDFDAYRLDAFAEQPGVCPGGGESQPVSGYDRELCLSPLVTE